MTERIVVLYIAQSLDGYIASKEDSLEWLLSVEGEGDNGFGKFYDSVDTIIMGRRTYDWIMEHENGNFPYSGKECIVCSSKYSGKNDYVEFVNNSIGSLVRKLKQSEGKKIWLVGGSQLIKTFQQEKLIDEYIINIAPVLIGDGIPLFDADEKENLRLKHVKTYGQFAELAYDVRRPDETGCISN